MNTNQADPSKPVVAIVMGSASDWPVLKEAVDVLRGFEVRFEAHVLSAHRTPTEAAEFARSAQERGFKVLIAAAGGAAHLAGVLAAHTTLPVLGVPLPGTPLNGLDALLSTVQMPPGVPVATLAIGQWGAINAALLAVQILALENPVLQQRLLAHKESLRTKAREADSKLQQEIASGRV
ncbi:MAG: 5-(carboxyamino)imidazole ribonucleotide mutase [Verrucomicrobiae bacterium]|nr:5-(carboxyamino)imidazole ribonucleotide mutase [Verrucomicrobiae bacterium]